MNRPSERASVRACELPGGDRSSHLVERERVSFITRQCGEIRNTPSFYDAVRRRERSIAGCSSRLGCSAPLEPTESRGLPQERPIRADDERSDLEASTAAAGGDSVTQEVTSAWKKRRRPTDRPTDLRAYSMRLRGSEQDGEGAEVNEREGHVRRRRSREGTGRRRKKEKEKRPSQTATQNRAIFAPTYGL